jgi:hypothetical protein
MLPALKIGGVDAARVAAIHPGGRISLVLGGTTLLARCAAGIAEGETVEVEVDRITPELVLRVRRSAGKSCRVKVPANGR